MLNKAKFTSVLGFLFGPMQSNIQQKQIRIDSLDWLRGCMAIAVMFYHLTLWLYHPMDAGTILGRLGIYAVAIFFVLSGLSMAIVYHSYFTTWKHILVFFTRRIFRIWPLLWIAILCVVLHPQSNFETTNWGNLVSTATTSFAIIQPAKYFIVGAWSIGNEMVYYLLTPLLCIAYTYHKSIGQILFAISAIIALVFAFHLLNPEVSLAKQWEVYVNPLNNLFFYVSGIWLYFSFNRLKINMQLNFAILMVSLGILIAMPTLGNQITLVSGLNRVVYAFFAITLVFTFYKNRQALPPLIQKIFQIIGESTYGIYLLHPIVYSYLGLIAKKMGPISSPLLFIITSVLTIFLAYGSFLFIEKPMIQLGKKWTS